MKMDIFAFSHCLLGRSPGRTLATLLVLAAGLPGIARAQVYDRPTYSSPIVISRDDKLIFAVNPGDDSVTVVRPDNNTAITKINVGDEPQASLSRPTAIISTPMPRQRVSVIHRQSARARFSDGGHQLHHRPSRGTLFRSDGKLFVANSSWVHE